MQDKYRDGKLVFRHVVWNGGKYGPGAFATSAKNKKGIKELMIMKEGKHQIECSKSIAKESGFILYSGITNKQILVHDAKPSSETCVIETENKESRLI